MSTGAEVELVSASNSMASSSARESTLPERSGRSAEHRLSEPRTAIEMGAVVSTSLGAQQKVSRVHNLQLKFSRRRPSSNDPAHREKTK